MKTKDILNKAQLSGEDLLYLMNLEDRGDLDLLFNHANEVRKKYQGQEVHLYGIIEFSTYCEENCLYCGLREENFSVERFRLSPEEIIENACKLSNLGVKNVILQSGDDSYYDTDMLAYIIYSIKQKADVSISLCIGPRGYDEYRSWRIAGADAFIMNFESSKPDIFYNFENNKYIMDRVQHLKFLKRTGYIVGSGSIIGLPGQKPENIVDDIIMCKTLQLDFINYSPFVPVAFTPFQNYGSADITQVLKTIAISRIYLQNVDIVASNALDMLDIKGSEKALDAGANLVINNLETTTTNLKLTPLNNSGNEGKGVHNHPSISNRIASLGRKIAECKKV